MTSMLSLRFRSGTLELSGLGAEEATTAALPGCLWDDRLHGLRAAAVDYAAIILALQNRGLAYEDHARRYPVLDAKLAIHRPARPYQQAAVDAWWKQQGRGVVVLPTGAGKSHVAVMAIDRCRRSAAVLAPTLDLVRQWYDLLRQSFGCEVGIVGGGEHKVEALTVMTYDSAYLHMEHLGARFGLLICDECHHLPSEAYALAARCCIAPFRLGLTATPERNDGRERDLEMLLGSTAFRLDIVDLSGEYLSDYNTVRLEVQLTREEQAQFDQARTVYRDFVLQHGIRMSSPKGWGEFIWRSSQSEAGRLAMAGYREQRRLSFAASAKLARVEALLHQHRGDRSLIFTQDNATAYDLSQRFLIPVITHQTKVSERSDILSGLRQGRYRAVVTSKVLNEGVDVPEANVAIVVSGSGSVREHVQRLGRILRKQADKSAVLYELITVRTGEVYTSERRREHSAYGR